VQQRYQRIITKLKTKEQINVVFLVHNCAKWNCQTIYDLFQEDPRFFVTVAIAFRKGRTKYDIDNIHKEHEFFLLRNMNCIILYDYETKKDLNFEQIKPDIVFYSEPATAQLKHAVITASRSSLTCYIPYGVMMIANQQIQFNRFSHLFVWKSFCETKIHHQLAEKYAFNRGSNVIVSGYPKMDKFFDNKKILDTTYWKVSRYSQPNIKRIIWAPHHSRKGVSFDTFTIYKDQFYNLLVNRPDIEILLKPHPLLEFTLLDFGILSSDEYHNFIDKWNKLSNASYYDGGNYIDIFRTSDAMVLDSISFICEYMYTEKPILFLCKRPDILKTGFNEFGLEAAKNMYEAHNWNDVETFIDNVVIQQNDPFRERRINFRENVLMCNKQPAGEFIVNYIKETLK
jgi:hypothetical protein